VTGPRAVPGNYQVKLTVGGKTLTENFEIKKDPRIATTPEDFARQFDLLWKIRNKLDETHKAILKIRDIRQQVEAVSKRIGSQANAKAVVEQGKTLNAKLTSLEEALYQTKNQSSQDPLNYPIRLNNKLAALGGSVGGSDSAPTDQALQVYDDLVGKINVELQKLEQTIKTDVPAFNQAVKEIEVPAVIVK
jgi:DNA-binding FrmR family transcriptional regulator